MNVRLTMVRMNALLPLVALACAALPGAVLAEPVQVPGHAAYAEPDPDGFQVGPSGVTGWSDGKQTVAWYGKIGRAGALNVSVRVRVPAGEKVAYRLAVGNTERAASVTGTGKPSTVDFGAFTATAGYMRFGLKGVSRSGGTYGNILGLTLDGPAMEGAHFSTMEHRNAASVHLFYPLPAGLHATWFYNEVKVRTEPLWSYYMACGFDRGYFGIQVNSPTERHIIFSVWDSGTEPTSRDRVASEDRVQLLAKGPNVFAGDFGNEGTGGHSHLIYPWKKDRTYRFLVSAEPEGTHTTYSGYFYFPETQQWGLIARFRAPKDGGWLRGLYSFNEDFVGSNGQLQRVAEFGPGWVKTDTGEWHELNVATFSHDVHGRRDRLDYGAHVTGHAFTLLNGGFKAEPIRYGQRMERQATGKPPVIGDLPK